MKLAPLPIVADVMPEVLRRIHLYVSWSGRTATAVAQELSDDPGLLSRLAHGKGITLKKYDRIASRLNRLCREMEIDQQLAPVRQKMDQKLEALRAEKLAIAETELTRKSSVVPAADRIADSGS